MRYLIGVFFFFCFEALRSQTPGYLGQKNIAYIGMRSSVIPAIESLIDPTGSEPTYNRRTFFWNVGAKRVITRSSTIGLSGSYFKDNVFGATATNRIPSEFAGFDIAFDLRTYFYSSKGSIAPLGKHMRYNLIYSSYVLNTVANNIQVGRVNFVGLGIGKGNSRVFYDKIWVDYGWEFNWMINVYDQQDIVTGWDYTKQTQNILQSAYAVYFNLVVGYLY